MAYFSSSNYEQYYDNYQFYQPYYDDNVDYDTQESRYVQYDYSDHTQYYNNEFQVAPSQSLVGYYCSNNNNTNNNDFFGSKNANFHENGDYYYDPVSTQFVISYNISEKEANDLVFKEYNPEPYHGGYDINETYGKALPPSIDICYPPTKINPNLSVPLPYGKEEPKLEAESKPETNLIGSDEDEDFEDEDEDDNDGKQEILQNVEGEEKPKSILVLEENVIDSEEDEDEDEDQDEDEDEDEDEDKDKDKDTDGKQEILQNFEGEEKPKSILVLEENVIDSEEDEDEDEDEDQDEDEDEDEDEEDEDNGEQVIMPTLEGGKEDIASKVNVGHEKEEGNRGNEDGYGKEIRRQITPGYGMEAIDICEGLFGGYFPCLLKKNKGGSCKQCGGSGVKLRNMDEYECWQGTVDYFFGNPNPYGGSMPEKGSYGDPMLSYQRYYPQESIVGEVKYEENENENENSSWLHDYSRFNYGHN
ncbi:uncharacterized protein LOC141592992 [Silene latifolia]|uniref:uncharacterized protein LOC141592992 n=1 Tax=Silene latifolia TaxID=37657 RepID=UPI003D780D45